MCALRIINEGNIGNKKFDKTKRKKKEDFSKVTEDGYKAVNTVFTKSIHKIMFDMQNKTYFEWPRPMGGNPIIKNTKLRCSYHKDCGYRSEHYKIHKQFLEG